LIFFDSQMCKDFFFLFFFSFMFCFCCYVLLNFFLLIFLLHLRIYYSTFLIVFMLNLCDCFVRYLFHSVYEINVRKLWKPIGWRCGGWGEGWGMLLATSHTVFLFLFKILYLKTWRQLHYKLLKKIAGNILDFHKILYIDATAIIMQARMLKMHTRTQQTPALTKTACCAACAPLECDRAFKNVQELTNMTVFCCFSIFATASFW
jgi:hypothetical protein